MTDASARESLCIKIPKVDGEKTLRIAQKLGIGDRELQLQRDDSAIYIPLVRTPKEEELVVLRTDLLNWQLETRRFQRKKTKKTLKDTLEKQIHSIVPANLPRALDIIGDIAIIEIPPELKNKEKTVGEAVLQSHPTIKTVLAKAGAIKGEYRLREFTVIAGEETTITLHKEYGCKYKIDLAKAYFSPRLSQEHKRVASLIQKGETVVDLFAGVGPFSVLAAKMNPSARVYAVDVNPEAIKLLAANVRLNRVEDRVVPILGDANTVVEERLIGIADRVIMNLPEGAIKFIPTACRAINSSGGIVHYYGFVRVPDTVHDLQTTVCEEVERTGRSVEKFLTAKTIRETAPYQVQAVLDFRII